MTKKSTSKLAVILRFLRPWQSALASLVGFGGVITTLSTQYYLTSKTEQNRLIQEEDAARASFMVEIISIHGYAKGIVDYLNRPREPNAGIYFSFVVQDFVFKTNLGKISLLRTSEAQAIFEVYVNQQRLLSSLSSYETPQSNSSVKIVKTSAENYDYMLRTVNDFYRSTKDTLVILCRYSKATCDLGL